MPARIDPAAVAECRLLRPSPGHIIDRVRRVLGERVQKVCQQQFLVLLLVMKPDLDDRPHRFEIVRGFDQGRYRRIDVRTIGCRLGDTRTCDQAALRAGVPWPGRDIIRVEQKREAVVERPIGRREWPQQKLFEEPRYVRPVPFCWAGVRHRLHDLILGGEERRAAFGLGAHVMKSVAPILPRIAGRLRDGGIRTGCIMQSNGGAWHQLGPENPKETNT